MKTKKSKPSRHGRYIVSIGIVQRSRMATRRREPAKLADAAAEQLRSRTCIFLGLVLMLRIKIFKKTQLPAETASSALMPFGDLRGIGGIIT